MNLSSSARLPIAVACAVLVALSGAAKVHAASASGHDPTVVTGNGGVHGVHIASGYAFRGLPYASPPTRDLRWRAPQPPAAWRGIRDATHYAPSCPQKPSLFQPPGPQSEDCLYLNVSTPTLRRDAKRPVLVWIHGGGFTEDGALNYDGTKLAGNGIVVVTINYRLGVFGFLAHRALASRRGGPSGNYGLMDQQAALRWVKHDIARFGGDPHNLTIAGRDAATAGHDELRRDPPLLVLGCRLTLANRTGKTVWRLRAVDATRPGRIGKRPGSSGGSTGRLLLAVPTDDEDESAVVAVNIGACLNAPRR